MKTLILSLLSLVTMAWGWEVFSSVAPADASTWWLARQQALHLSGLLSVAMMSLVMFLATRPAWLETPLGGMDRIYRTHKWAGITAVAFAAAHWLIEMSDDILKAMVGREGRVDKEKFTGFLEVLRDLAEDMGEWAIYAVLAMLVITLWKKFPYRAWRMLHQAMPVLYLMLAFHAALLVPTNYWAQPVGLLLGALLLAGVYGAVASLRKVIGKSRQVIGQVVLVEDLPGDVCAVRCRLNASWHGHRAGQFAFVTFEGREGAHPFTIASADQGDGAIDFQIKALGDYTRGLAQRLQVGQSVRVEGPYGRFDLSRRHHKADQIWIAGGIGVTPFLAWLESLQPNPQQAPSANLHYCTRNQATDSLAQRLIQLCATLPSVRLSIHDASQGANLKAHTLGATGKSEIWFCGPTGLGQSLREGLKAMGVTPRFHQEAFEMR
ncbi:MAG: ferric reductase-like transmembrane domain-containing protein [Gammaproteobacteria bacterium]|uniref:ferredoxin reductase family protein n=1 Tax=Rhodoferax sp. TaxID=50421 RepID=UPI00179D82CC|nr:ferric reductase-like transmembrane domain-containing protein [Rhodoferax sp.]MBU3898108.1 ferric reductase-like transmembrane domain-containing protein [Gammaproteobacteria bacterium]MBA3058610.1 ferric reductase [Rhodoferax sp.]MBU3999135.1 ferric reductase-like transmembrane domain-containing protein [Gammaproteobacteria bacterium]MBU4081698.1 ferric reductase-like transmembrane domain-containing protein [Gammaproteobacteria bacterium]MBU4113544.1 ferric reductase-like transmembrane doma